MQVLIVCTSNVDRSPALRDYFKQVFPNHTYYTAGVNKYFTSKKGSHYVSSEDINDADLIILAEEVHYHILLRDFPIEMKGKNTFSINAGTYQQGAIGEDYLTRAEIIVGDLLK